MVKEKNIKKVEKKKVSKQKAPKTNFFKSVITEMKLVKWPSGKDIIKNTIATITLCLIVSGFFIILNLLLAMVKGWFV